jgi:hypothetical protein
MDGYRAPLSAVSQLLASDDGVAIFWLAAVAFVCLAALSPSRGVVTAVFVVCLAALAAGEVVARHRRADIGAVSALGTAQSLLRSGRELRAGAGASAPPPPTTTTTVEGVYQLLRVPAGGLVAVAAHGDAVAALATLAPYSRPGYRGWLQRAATCLEAFYERYHDLLLLTPGGDDGRVRLEVPLLLDARAEALNALHAVENGVINAAVGPVRRAVTVLRASMARCLRVLANKHGGRAGEGGALRGVCWRAPYPHDPTASPHLVEL